MRCVPIKGFEEYQITDNGKVVGKYGRFLKPANCGKGYLFVGLMKDKKRYLLKIHHLVLENFGFPRPPGLQANHKNGIKRDNRIENLEWVTASENQRHAYAIGLKKSPVGLNIGEKNGQAKLKNCEVWLIKKILKSGLATHEFIGKMFKVCGGTVTMIKKDDPKAWRKNRKNKSSEWLGIEKGIV